MLGIGYSYGVATLGAASGPSLPTTRHAVLLGQSEIHRLFLNFHASLGDAAAVVDEDALEIWWYDLDLGTPNNATGVQRDAITNSNKVSAWAVAMSNAFAAINPGVQFKVCVLAFSGTGLDDLLDDAQVANGRYWTRDTPFNGDKECFDAFKADTGFVEPDAGLMSWTNTDSTQLTYQIGEAWFAALTGTRMDTGAAITRGAQVYNVDYDHFLSDLWNTDTVPFAFLMHRYDVFTGSSIDFARFRNTRVSLDRTVTSARNIARDVPIVRGVDPMAYENGYDVSDDSHPRKSADGAVKYAQQLAYNIALLTGTNLPAPRLDSVVWTASSVTLSSDAGALTTARLIRGGTLPAGQPKVAQLYFRSATDPTTLVEVPDAAITITGGDIVIDATVLAGRNFQRGDAIEFASGPGGANDAQDKTDDTWLDYPGMANPTLEIVPLQPVAGVMRCDLAATQPTNRLQDFVTWATGNGLVDQGGGWYIAPSNSIFDSNTAGQIDTAGMPSGADSLTFVVDLDREIGRSGGFSTQINFRDTNGISHQRLVTSNLWGEVTQSVPTASPTTFGWIPLPDGRVRAWMHVTRASSGRVQAYLNSSNTGGAFGFAGLYDGALTVAQIAAL